MLNELVSNFLNDKSYENAEALVNYCHAHGDEVDGFDADAFDEASDILMDAEIDAKIIRQEADIY